MATKANYRKKALRLEETLGNLKDAIAQALDDAEEGNSERETEDDES